MTLAELYTEAARVAKMIEGTELEIGTCIKFKGKALFSLDEEFMPDKYGAADYIFALAIVEGKPVFVGDELYDPYERRCRVTGLANDNCIIGDGRAYHIWSWNPPQPKTVMVELLVEDAKYIVYGMNYCSVNAQRSKEACRKALEEMK